ncbi:MAG: ABC transporter substrate-binding protein [Clostridiales bacterium]|nr:ABC transporter substrate-binding protein [Clostridiales bacterium]
MKRYLALATALLLALSLTPLAATADQAAMEIEFWHIYPADAAAEHMTGMLQKFTQENPGVAVKELGVSFWDYNDKLTPALAAGTGPDLFMNDLGNPKARAMNGQIMNLQPFIDASGLDLTQFLPASLEQCTYEGEVYAFPFITDTRVLYWNKDQFAAVGLNPEEPPKSWDDVIRYNELLTVFKEGSTTEAERIGFSTRLGNFYEWTLGWTFGAQLFDDEGNPTIDSPELLEALQTAIRIQDQVGLDAFNTFQEGTKSLQFSPFIAETVSMIVETNDLYARIKTYNPELNFGVALIPTKDGVNHHASWGNGFSLEIADKGDAARAQAAFDLGVFLTRTDNALSFVKNNSDFVCNRLALRDESLMADPVWKVMVDSGDVTLFRPFIAEYPWYASTSPEWEAALRAQKTPEQALADAQAAVEQEIANYRMLNP